MSIGIDWCVEERVSILYIGSVLTILAELVMLLGSTTLHLGVLVDGVLLEATEADRLFVKRRAILHAMVCGVMLL